MLWFWVVVLVVLIGAIAILAAGRGDSMVEVYDDRPDVSLPAGRPLNADDLRSVRLNTGVRGYRMDEVDALLARLEAEMLEREDLAEARFDPADTAMPADREPSPAAQRPPTAESREVSPDEVTADEAEPDTGVPDEAEPGEEHRAP